MQSPGLRAGLQSAVRGAHPVALGGPARSAVPKLGMRVPWGASFDLGVSITDAMRRSVALGVRVANFSEEVC